MEAAPESGVLILVPKRRSWKQRNAREWGLKERCGGGVGEYWLSKKGSFPTHTTSTTDGRTRTSNTVGLLARRVDYVLHNYDAGACGGSLLGGVPWNEELLTHSQKQQQHCSSSLCFGKFESWLPFFFFFSSPQLQLTLLPPPSPPPPPRGFLSSEINGKM